MEENEEDDDSSSSLSFPSFHQFVNDLSPDREELAKFRSEWQKELLLASKSTKSKEANSKSNAQLSAELYQMAAFHEQSGLLNEAVNLYRQAFKLCPDVEQKYGRRPFQEKNQGNES